MDISLAPNVERILRLKVAEGLYDSLNEAINSTLSMALANTCIDETQIAMLNVDIQQGVDEADAGQLTDAFEFLDELNSKYE